MKTMDNNSDEEVDLAMCFNPAIWMERVCRSEVLASKIDALASVSSVFDIWKQG